MQLPSLTTPNLNHARSLAINRAMVQNLCMYFNKFCLGNFSADQRLLITVLMLGPTQLWPQYSQETVMLLLSLLLLLLPLLPILPTL
jgi:hypothetical protein